MGGYGAIKLALQHPSIFLGAAAQRAQLNVGMYSSNFSEYRTELNKDYPELFDVFGSGKTS
jgi:S-formylglutathione hydrolase FrmB